MAAKQDNDDDMDDISEEMEGEDDIDSLMELIETAENIIADTHLTARRKIEDLLEERRLREQIGDFMDLE